MFWMRWLHLVCVGPLVFLRHDVIAANQTESETSLGQLAIELGAPFHDNMILQRGMKVPVWGWGEPGVEVSVEFAGQRKAATAGQDGRWSLDLDPMEASFEPAELVVAEIATSHSPLKRVVINNVLVGEVWMCSGQSNMQWSVANCNVSQLVEQIRARVEAAVRAGSAGFHAQCRGVYPLLAGLLANGTGRSDPFRRITRLPGGRPH